MRPQWLVGWLLALCFANGCCLILKSETIVQKSTHTSVVTQLPSGARIQGRLIDGVPTYSGIRYATARRFEAPELWTPSPNETIHAEGVGPRCPQAESLQLVGTEDCLFLGVVAPDTAEAKAVMVFIHGGTLVDDRGDPSEYSFQALASEGGVVVVSIEYRLNFFGFYSDPESTSQNNGLRDQIAALQWVQQHIRSFGGDPERVTIFGQSAGGLSVLALFQSPLAQELFHRGIAQSPGYWGPAQFHVSSSEAFASMGQECLRATGCSTSECLRQLSMQKIYELCPKWFTPGMWVNDPGAYFAGSDGQVLREPLHTPLCEGRAVASSQKPLITGSLSHEFFLDTELYLPSAPLDKILSQYTKGYASANASAKDRIFQCVRSRYMDAAVADGTPPDWFHLNGHLEYMLAAQLGAATVGGPRYRYLLDFGAPQDSSHMTDMCYLTSTDPSTANAGPQLHFCGPNSLTAEKKRMGRMLREYWSSFAKTGVPTSALGPKWEPVDPSTGLVALPLLGLRFHNSSAMDYAAYNQTAALLAGINCGHNDCT